MKLIQVLLKWISLSIGTSSRQIEGKAWTSLDCVQMNSNWILGQFVGKKLAKMFDFWFCVVLNILPESIASSSPNDGHLITVCAGQWSVIVNGFSDSSGSSRTIGCSKRNAPIDSLPACECAMIAMSYAMICLSIHLDPARSTAPTAVPIEFAN